MNNFNKSKTNIFLRESPSRDTLPQVVAATCFPMGSRDYSIQTASFVLAAVVTGQGTLKSFTIMEKSSEIRGSNPLLLAIVNSILLQ